MILPFLVSTYARNIYMTGTARFATIPEGYRSDVMGYAAKNYYIDDIDRAKSNGWVTAQEHEDTLARKTEEDPQYRPA